MIYAAEQRTHITRPTGLSRAIRVVALVGIAACPLETAVAQRSGTEAFVDVRFNAGSGCFDRGRNAAGASGAGCTASPAGILSSASASSVNSSRDVSLTTSVAITDRASSVLAQASASQYGNGLLINGPTVPTDDIVFHFLTSLTGSGYFLLALYPAYASPELFDAAFALDGSLQRRSNDPNVSIGLGSLDFRVAVSAFPGSSGYDFTAIANTLAFGSDFGPDLQSSSADVGIRLAAIDLVDGEGNLISSARFDAFGYATINAIPAVTPAPEPRSVMLLATGLLGLLPVAVGHRQRATSAGWTASGFVYETTSALRARWSGSTTARSLASASSL